MGQSIQTPHWNIWNSEAAIIEIPLESFQMNLDLALPVLTPPGHTEAITRHLSSRAQSAVKKKQADGGPQSA